MSRRAFLCPVVEGVGLDGQRTFEPRLPELPQGTSASFVIPTDRDGAPIYTHALAVLTASDHVAIDADAEIEKLQAVPAKCDDAELAKLMAERAAKRG